MIDVNSLPRAENVFIRDGKNQSSIRIAFTYRGVKCREPFSLRKKPAEDKANLWRNFERGLKMDLQAAANKLGAINREIAAGCFSYSEHFPDSKRCTLFGETVKTNATVGDYLQQLLERYETGGTVSKSTLKNYKKAIKSQLKPEFGEIIATELTPAMVANWVTKKSQVAKRKTISNILSPLKKALDMAVMERVLVVNPAAVIKLDDFIRIESRQSEFEPDPFVESDINHLLGFMQGQIKNLFQTAFYTGVRTSELIGLTWDKIDFKNRSILIDQAWVEGEMKGLKTSGKGVQSRIVLMLDPVFEALKDQKRHTFLAGDRVFHHPVYQKPWQNDAQVRKWAWTPAVKKSGLRYRNPYQTRHSYACLMIRDNENLWWIASQLGHTGIEMLNRHYGKFIEEVGDRYTPKRLFDASSFSPKISPKISK